jgi:alkyl hydroperoxide reductase subunit D
MTLDTLLSADTARDLRLNLRVIREPRALSPAQAWGAALAAAFAARGASVLAAVAAEARAHLPPPAERAARTAATLMGMNNIYYRFMHLVGAPEYGQMSAGLRMQGLATADVSKLDLELWSLSASIVNGCGMCMTAHERQLRAAGASPEMVQDVARIAAVVHAAAAAVEGAEVLDAAVEPASPAAVPSV